MNALRRGLLPPAPGGGGGAADCGSDAPCDPAEAPAAQLAIRWADVAAALATVAAARRAAHGCAA